MGVRLKQAGVDPSRYYTCTFELNPDWTTFTAADPEVREYFDRVACRYEVMPHLHFGSEIVACAFNGRWWWLRTRDGHETVADFVLTACGVLHHPQYSDIPARRPSPRTATSRARASPGIGDPRRG